MIKMHIFQNNTFSKIIPSDGTESNHGVRPIHSLSVYLVSTPILHFPYCSPTEELFSTWRWRVHNSPPLKQATLLQAIDDACNDITGDQCLACVCRARRFYPRCLANENIHYDVDENLWPNPRDRVDKNIEFLIKTYNFFFYLFFGSNFFEFFWKTCSVYYFVTHFV